MKVASGQTCVCGYWNGSETESGKRPLPWGRDRLDLHRGRVIAELLAGDWREGLGLAQEFFDATKGDNGDAELEAGWAMAEWIKAVSETREEEK